MPKAFEQEASQSMLCEKSTSLILKAIMAVGRFRGTVCACMDSQHFCQILPEDVALRRGNLLVKNKTKPYFKYFVPPNQIFNATSTVFNPVRRPVQNTCHWPYGIWKGCSLVNNLEILRFTFAHIHTPIKNKNNNWDRWTPKEVHISINGYRCQILSLSIMLKIPSIWHYSIVFCT